jgi:hypothetical protein
MRTLLSFVALSLAATSAFAGPKDYTLTPAGEAKFQPVDPKQPQGLQAAIIQGNPKTGPVAFLLKIPKGKAPIHWHNSDYWAVTVEGQTKHWLAGKDEGNASGPGTSWFQPGGSAATAHGDECMSDGGCLVYIYMTKGIDIQLAKK